MFYYDDHYIHIVHEIIYYYDIYKYDFFSNSLLTFRDRKNSPKQIHKFRHIEFLVKFEEEEKILQIILINCVILLLN